MFVPNFSFKYNGEQRTLTDAKIVQTEYGKCFEFEDGFVMNMPEKHSSKIIMYRS